MQGHETERVSYGNEYEVTCVQCGEGFMAKRSDASFCKPACRTAHNRDKKAMKDHIWRYGANARALVKDIQHSKTLPKSELIAMAREIVFILQTEILDYDQRQHERELEREREEKRRKRDLGLE